MKYTLPILAILASSALSHGQVTFNADFTINDGATQIGTYSATGADPFDTPTGAMFQGALNNQTVSFSILTLDSNYEIAGPLTIGSTNLVSGGINPNSSATNAASPDRAGFAIGAQGTSPIFSFSVPGVFDLGTYAAPTNDFSNTIGATVDGMVFASGGSLAADVDVVLDFVDGEYITDTFPLSHPILFSESVILSAFPLVELVAEVPIQITTQAVSRSQSTFQSVKPFPSLPLPLFWA